MRLEEMTVGILAGGKSSRMGSNKAELPYQNDSFLEHILRQAGRFSQRLVSVDSMEKYRWLSESSISHFKFVEDEYRDYGPVEGIYQLLRNTTTGSCFVIATDMPCLTESFFQSFVNEYGGEDCLVLQVDGRPEPLCSIYSRACIPVLEMFRRDGIHKPRILFEKVGVRYVDIEALGHAASTVSNINTPAEYKELLEEGADVHQ